MTFRWLHLSDLHLGHPDGATLLPAMRAPFFADLPGLVAAVGAPFDLVVFTGDLTWSGQESQFAEVDAFIATLFEELARISPGAPPPQVLAVPGNHDLQWTTDLGGRALPRLWEADLETRTAFWNAPAGGGREHVTSAFRGYSAWLARRLAGRDDIASGALPGDLAMRVVRPEFSMGIVGLNSAFLSLTREANEFKQALDPRQFHAVCGGDGAAWCAKNDVNLLLTHHAASDLSPRALEEFREQVFPPGRFAAHLHGHLHEGAATSVGSLGGTTRNTIQSPSLMGVAHYGGTRQRIHGYGAGALTRDAAGAIHLRYFPRRAYKTQDGPWRFSPDPEGPTLQTDGGTAAVVVGRARTTAPPEKPIALRRPPLSGVFAKEWYVPRPREEKELREVLNTPGGRIAIRGPAKSGKGWLLEHVLKGEERDGTKIFRFALTGAQSTLEAILSDLAIMLLDGVNHPDAGEAIRAIWRPPRSPQQAMEYLLGRTVLQTRGLDRLILAVRIDSRVQDFSLLLAFDAVLRAWTERTGAEPWSRLRLIVVESTAVNLLSLTDLRVGIGSPLRFSNTILLGDLGDDDVDAALRAAGFTLSPSDRKTLRSEIGGHPYLLNHFMRHWEVDTPIEEVFQARIEFARTGGSDDFFTPILDALSDPTFAGTLRSLARGEPLASAEVGRRLLSGGLATKEGGKLVLRYGVIRQLL